MSEGLVAERYLGAHYRRTQTDVDMPAVNSDSSLAVELRHSERLAENKEAYLQFALLYTNCEGQRRIRSAPLPQRSAASHHFEAINHFLAIGGQTLGRGGAEAKLSYTFRLGSQLNSEIY